MEDHLCVTNQPQSMKTLGTDLYELFMEIHCHTVSLLPLAHNSLIAALIDNLIIFHVSVNFYLSGDVNDGDVDVDDIAGDGDGGLSCAVAQ